MASSFIACPQSDTGHDIKRNVGRGARSAQATKRLRSGDEGDAAADGGCGDADESDDNGMKRSRSEKRLGTSLLELKSAVDGAESRRWTAVGELNFWCLSATLPATPLKEYAALTKQLRDRAHPFRVPAQDAENAKRAELLCAFLYASDRHVLHKTFVDSKRHRALVRELFAAILDRDPAHSLLQLDYGHNLSFAVVVMQSKCSFLLARAFERVPRLAFALRGNHPLCTWSASASEYRTVCAMWADPRHRALRDEAERVCRAAGQSPYPQQALYYACKGLHTNYVAILMQHFTHELDVESKVMLGAGFVANSCAATVAEIMRKDEHTFSMSYPDAAAIECILLAYGSAQRAHREKERAHTTLLIATALDAPDVCTLVLGYLFAAH